MTSQFFFNCNLSFPPTILDHYCGDNFTHLKLSIALYMCNKNHQKTRDKLGSLVPVFYTVGIENFRF